MLASLVVFVLSQTRDQCFEEHEAAQRLRARGALVEALTRASVCAGPACPEAVRSDCTLFYERLLRVVPEVVVVVDDASVEVQVDGSPFAPPSPTSVRVDPGPHTWRARDRDGRIVARSLLLHEGDGLVRVELKFEAVSPVSAKAFTPEVRQRPRRFWWIPALVSAASASIGTWQFLSAQSAYGTLTTPPTNSTDVLFPEAAQALVQSGERARTAGWVGLGVALLALGGTIVLLLLD